MGPINGKVDISLGQPKRTTRKARTSCLTCRARKIKCDETKPRCNRCVRDNRTCRGIWYEESTSTLPNRRLLPSGLALCALPSTHPRFGSSKQVGDLLYLAPLITADTSKTVPFDMKGLAKFMPSRTRALQGYMSHLPSTSGHDSALDSAVQCVSSRFKELYIASSSDKAAAPKYRAVNQQSLDMYTQALRNLQIALKDPVRSCSAEILCATELLLLFECLYGEENSASVTHADGVVRLIQHRGPHRFTTGLERGLLSAHMGYITIGATLTNKGCFMDGDGWQETLESCIIESELSTERSELILTFYIYIIPVIQLLKEVTDLILTQNDWTPQQVVAKRDHLVDRARHSLTRFTQIQAKMNQNSPNHKESGLGPFTCVLCEDYDYCRRWLNVALVVKATHVLLGRILIALEPHGALEAELAVRKLAEEAVKSQTERSSTTGPGVQMISSPFGSAVLKTTTAWEKFLKSGYIEPTDIIPAELFNGFLQAIGVK